MTEFWREGIGGYHASSVAVGVEIVVAETGARFRGAGRFDEELVFAIDDSRASETARCASRSWRCVTSQPLVEGFIEYVFVDAREMTPVEIPAAVRSMLPERA